MIVTMPKTTTQKIAKALVVNQEDYSMATGRVLTLIVVADIHDDIEAILPPIREAAHEHPSRVLVVRTAPDETESYLDAELLYGSDAGGSETVVMTLYGDMSQHTASVVTPLLLPDTPIVAWWPGAAPEVPSQHPIGAIAQRRITDASASSVLNKLIDAYSPGDSDMAWSRLTSWRGLVASALDRLPVSPVVSAHLVGAADDAVVQLAAGWLANRLGVPVTCEDYHDRTGFPVRRLVLRRETGDLEVVVEDATTLRISVPEHADSLVAFGARTEADCLAEELRHLDADEAFAGALRGIRAVN